MTLGNYSQKKITGTFQEDNWQKLCDSFGELFDELRLLEFRGSIKGINIDDHAHKHWHSDKDKIGFAKLIVSYEKNKLHGFAIKFFDSHDRKRYLELEVDCDKKIIILAGSLDNKDKLEDAFKEIISTFSYIRIKKNILNLRYALEFLKKYRTWLLLLILLIVFAVFRNQIDWQQLFDIKYWLKEKYSVPFKNSEIPQDLIASINFSAYELTSEPDKKIFESFTESKKDFLKMYKLSIYRLSIGNKDNIASLKDIYLEVGMPDVFFSWKQVGNYNSTEAEIYGSPAESFDNRLKGHVYTNTNHLKLKEIGPGGYVSFLILAGSRLPLVSENKVWEGVEIKGKYLSEGDGNTERRKAYIVIPKKEYRSWRED